MLYACTARFDVTRNLKKFVVLGMTKQGLILEKSLEIRYDLY